MTPPPDRLAAALADRYRLDRELGAGGMATVYLAHDLRHEREVAIKVLHPDLGAALGAERFLSEIKTTARLSHPHILPLLDSGAADGFLYYVMPLVTGETLRGRLARERQLPVADALRIAREVADALHAAHAVGIVHRDIKPENILLQGGHALVADFGIALAVQSAGGARMTQTGFSLGTPQYMSPEQAMGERTLDARADVYALGAVTYEMLTGDPPFTGSSVQAIVARLLAERPTPLTTLRDTVPPHVEAVVLRALAKLPADRPATALAFAEALLDGGAPPAAPAPRGGRGATPAAAGWLTSRTGRVAVGLLAAVAVLEGAVLTRVAATPSPLPPVFDAALPDSAPLATRVAAFAIGFGTAGMNMALAPDGTFLVYRAQQGDTAQLWFRSLVDASAHPIPGTGGAVRPRISPDGQRIAFVVGDRTLLVPVEGGEPRRLLDGDPPVSLQWVSANRLFAVTGGGYTFTWIDPETGKLEDRALGRFTRCVFGEWLAEQEQLLCSFNETAVIADPRTGESWPVRNRAADGGPGAPVSGVAFQRVDAEHIMYVSLGGELRAARFDPRTRLVGRPVTIATGIDRDAVGTATLELARSGLLGYVLRTGGFESRLVATRGNGPPVPLDIERAEFLRFDLSPDRRRLAAVVATAEGNELRVYDLRTGQRQVWLRGLAIRTPLWSPDNEHLAVSVQTADALTLLWGSPLAAAAPETLMRGTLPTEAFDALDFADGNTLLARDLASSNLYRLDLRRRPVAIDTIADDVVYATVAPDGRRVAWHASNAPGLFVSRFPQRTDKIQIASVGIEPQWLSDTALVYRSGATWFLARFDARTGDLRGQPRQWASDEGFLDTPGWSNRSGHDGSLLYLQTAAVPPARFVRFIPDFVQRVRSAVREAERGARR
ncbi:MAG: protein kinase [Gemmatimonadaceae bacterium]|nr:protein kinase [Gemmatimonadaceae bacterium]